MRKKTLLSVFLAALIVASGTVAAVGGSLNWGAEPAPQIEHSVTKTKAVHNMTWGTSVGALSKYEGDDGTVHTLEAEVNTSVNNSVQVTPTDIEFADAGAFPHSKADVSALEASEWAGTGTASDVQTAPGVNAVSLDLAANDYMEFSNFSVTSDIEKRYLQVVFDVPSITSGAIVEFRVVDGDGDYYMAEINTSRSSGENYMASASGEGYIYQAQLGTLTVTPAGDGSFGNAEALNVTETGGSAATVEISALNLDKTGTWDFGSHLANTDDDDELESVDNTEKKTPGMMELGVDISEDASSTDPGPLSTLGPAFDSALLHNIQIEMVETAQDQPDENVYTEFTKDDSVEGGDYPGYFGTATIAVRITDRSAYDLSSANGVLTATQTMQTNRILSVKYAEGVPADEAVDSDYLDSVTFTDVTDQFSDEGSTVQLDATTSPGEPMLVKFKLRLTENQFNALQNVGGGGGSGAQTSGGLGSIPIIGGLLVALLGVLKRFGS